MFANMQTLLVALFTLVVLINNVQCWCDKWIKNKQFHPPSDCLQEHRSNGFEFSYCIPKGPLALSEGRFRKNLIQLPDNDLRNITRLHLQGSRINDIRPGGLSGLKKAREIEITQNFIPVLKGRTFFNLPVEKIILTNNRIAVLEKHAFHRLPHLDTLNLQGNDLEKFDSASTRECENLAKLNLSKNKLRRLGKDAFRHLPLLKEIDLSKNLLCNLNHHAFRDLEGLKKLDLSNNYLRQLDWSNPVFERDRTAVLYLNGNHLGYLTNKMLRKLSVLNTLCIDTNPWKCGCHSRIIKWARENNVELVAVSPQEPHPKPVCVVPMHRKEECAEEIDVESLKVFFNEMYDDSLYC